MTEIVVLTKAELREEIVFAVSVFAEKYGAELAQMKTREWMNKNQLAEYLDWSVPKINYLMNKGLPFHSRENTNPLFNKSEIDEWLKN